jgi:hypothetical protein
MTNLSLQIRDGKSPLTKIFICHGAPCSMAGMNPETIEGESSRALSTSRSAVARDLFLLFKSGSQWIMPVQKVVLAAANEQGTLTDVIGVQLKEGYQWDNAILTQAKGFFQHRVTDLTGVALPSTAADFAQATDKDVKAVFAATLPSEVYKDNQAPDKAVVITGIDRRQGNITYKMSQACGAGDCGILSLAGTKGRIKTAMHAHYGVKVTPV